MVRILCRITFHIIACLQVEHNARRFISLLGMFTAAHVDFLRASIHQIINITVEITEQNDQAYMVTWTYMQ